MNTPAPELEASPEAAPVVETVENFTQQANEIRLNARERVGGFLKNYWDSWKSTLIGAGEFIFGTSIDIMDTPLSSLPGIGFVVEGIADKGAEKVFTSVSPLDPTVENMSDLVVLLPGVNKLNVDSLFKFRDGWNSAVEGWRILLTGRPSQPTAQTV